MLTTKIRSGSGWIAPALLGLALSATTFAQDAAAPAAAPEGPSPADLKVMLDTLWVMMTAFLVFWMNAGFGFVESGLCRAKNAAHTMSMNFLVYALGMFGFFVSGFALMCGGMNGTAIGGPASLGGLPTLSHMFSVGSSVNGDHGWACSAAVGSC